MLLEVRYLPGQSNILADLLSRRNQVLDAEWSLHPQVAKKIIRKWGSLTIDLFATHFSVKLPLYCSLIPDPQAVFEDAFHHPWKDLDLYAFPPLHLVESQRHPKSLHDSSRSPLAGEDVVRRPPPPTDPTTSGAAAVGPLPAPTTLQSVPRRHPRPELLSVSSESQDFQDELRASCPVVSESTARLYQSQWLSFCGWCGGRGVTMIDATIPVIVDFLIHLRQDKGFSLLALKGYRATINSVLTLKGVDLANSKELSMLFRSFAKSCSPRISATRPGTWPWSYRA